MVFQNNGCRSPEAELDLHLVAVSVNADAQEEAGFTKVMDLATDHKLGLELFTISFALSCYEGILDMDQCEAGACISNSNEEAWICWLEAHAQQILCAAGMQCSICMTQPKERMMKMLIQAWVSVVTSCQVLFSTASLEHYKSVAIRRSSMSSIASIA